MKYAELNIINPYKLFVYSPSLGFPTIPTRRHIRTSYTWNKLSPTNSHRSLVYLYEAHRCAQSENNKRNLRRRCAKLVRLLVGGRALRGASKTNNHHPPTVCGGRHRRRRRTSNALAVYRIQNGWCAVCDRMRVRAVVQAAVRLHFISHPSYPCKRVRSSPIDASHACLV